MLDMITSGRNAEDHSSTVIGVFGCLRVILPYICKPTEPQDVETQQTDSLLHIYELCLHYTKWHSDHNVVNAALETLAQLLKAPPKPLVSVLLSSRGITQSRIILNQNACIPSLGHMSISSASTAYGGNSDSILNLHEPDIPEITPNAEWIADTETLSITSNTQTQDECTSDATETKEKILENYCNLKIETTDNDVTEEGSDIESEMEKSEKTPYPSLQNERSKGDDNSENTLSFASPKKSSLDFALYETYVGSFTDSDMPVKFCCRYLVSSFLLAGRPGQLISDKLFRVSVKSLALTCVGYILKLYPHLFTTTVAKEPSCNETNQLIADILLF
ncbi:PREDICTED: huntingtin-like, partial [Wasmannia auropunctata]